MIYKLGSNLKQFYKEPFLLQTYLQLFILTILLINGPRNAHQIYIYIYIYIVYIQYDRGCKDYKIETESEYTILYNLL